MASYNTYYNGDWIRVYDLDSCIQSIKYLNDKNESTISQLREENRKLKEEYNKDKEIQNLQEQLDNLFLDYYRGFPIEEEEHEAINKWKEHHEQIEGCTGGGAAGGKYSYEFTPTAVGTSGVIKCTCGAEFEFQKIG